LHWTERFRMIRNC